MTPEGKDFVDKVNIVKALIQHGTKPFPAMASIFEDRDWTLIYVAVTSMAKDIKANK